MHSLHDNMKFLLETNKQGETFRRAAVCPRNTKQIPAIPGKRATQLNFPEIVLLNLTQWAFQRGVCTNIQNKEEIGWEKCPIRNVESSNPCFLRRRKPVW